MNDLSKAIDRQVGGNHYKGMKIQPMVYNYVNNIPYIDGNIIKYVSTWRFREGLLDLEKALHYLEYLIANVKAEQEEAIKFKNKPNPNIKTMAPATQEDGRAFTPGTTAFDTEPVMTKAHVDQSGTPEDGGHHAKQSDE